MTRILALIGIASVLAACGDTSGTGNGSSTNTGDGNDPGTELVDASVYATIGGNDMDGISFDIISSDGVTGFSAETTYTDQLATGSYTVSNVSGSSNGVSYLACNDVNATVSSDSKEIEVPLTIDLRDTTWTCDGVPNAVTVSGTCRVDISTVGGDFQINGYTLTAQSEHWTATGTISVDARTINIVTTYTYDGSTSTSTCTR